MVLFVILKTNERILENAGIYDEMAMLLVTLGNQRVIF